MSSSGKPGIQTVDQLSVPHLHTHTYTHTHQPARRGWRTHFTVHGYYGRAIFPAEITATFFTRPCVSARKSQLAVIQMTVGILFFLCYPRLPFSEPTLGLKKNKPIIIRARADQNIAGRSNAEDVYLQAGKILYYIRTKHIIDV